MSRLLAGVVAIELRALAGVTYPLIDKTFKPDGQTRYAAVHPGLPAGRYTIWRAHTPVAAVTVTGGQVSSCRWPG